MHTRLGQHKMTYDDIRKLVSGSCFLIAILFMLINIVTGIMHIRFNFLLAISLSLIPPILSAITANLLYRTPTTRDLPGRAALWGALSASIVFLFPFEWLLLHNVRMLLGDTTGQWIMSLYVTCVGIPATVIGATIGIGVGALIRKQQRRNGWIDIQDDL